jgi:hypothetical protein
MHTHGADTMAIRTTNGTLAVIQLVERTGKQNSCETLARNDIGDSVASLHTIVSLHFRRQAECSSLTSSLDSRHGTNQGSQTCRKSQKIGPFLHLGKDSWPWLSRRSRSICMRPRSQSREECQLLGLVRQFVNSSVPRTNQNKVTNSARLRCSQKRVGGWKNKIPVRL